jgi:hypothetical protein
MSNDPAKPKESSPISGLLIFLVARAVLTRQEDIWLYLQAAEGSSNTNVAPPPIVSS